MIIQQVAYEIPVEIMQRLATGEYTTFGSVVRNSSRIVTHLKEVTLPPAKHEAALARIATAVSDNKGVLLIGLGTAAVVVGGAIWVAGKKKQASELEASGVVENYNSTLAAYLEAIQTGTLTVEILDDLITALDALSDNVTDGKIIIELSVEQTEMLVKLVVDYTAKLAEANAVDVDVADESASEAVGGSVVDLRKYLERQKRIFDSAA